MEKIEAIYLRPGHTYEKVLITGDIVRNKDLSECTFIKCKFKVTKWWKCNFTNVTLDDCEMRSQLFAGCNLATINWDNSNIAGSLVTCSK